jgi:hypothetical protein
MLVIPNLVILMLVILKLVIPMLVIPAKAGIQFLLLRQFKQRRPPYFIAGQYLDTVVASSLHENPELDSSLRWNDEQKSQALQGLIHVPV